MYLLLGCCYAISFHYTNSNLAWPQFGQHTEQCSQWTGLDIFTIPSSRWPHLYSSSLALRRSPEVLAFFSLLIPPWGTWGLLEPPAEFTSLFFPLITFLLPSISYVISSCFIWTSRPTFSPIDAHPPYSCCKQGGGSAQLLLQERRVGLVLQLSLKMRLITLVVFLNLFFLCQSQPQTGTKCLS